MKLFQVASYVAPSGIIVAQASGFWLSLRARMKRQYPHTSPARPLALFAEVCLLLFQLLVCVSITRLPSANMPGAAKTALALLFAVMGWSFLWLQFVGTTFRSVTVGYRSVKRPPEGSTATLHDPPSAVDSVTPVWSIRLSFFGDDSSGLRVRFTGTYPDEDLRDRICQAMAAYHPTWICPQLDLQLPRPFSDQKRAGLEVIRLLRQLIPGVEISSSDGILGILLLDPASSSTDTG